MQTKQTFAIICLRRGTDVPTQTTYGGTNMQKPISYRSLRALFIPEGNPQTSPAKLMFESSKKEKNILTQIMPIEQVSLGISKSYAKQQAVYITVRRKIATLNTKDIRFGIFKTDYSQNMILFEDVDADIVRMLKVEDILSIRRPN